MLLIMPVLSRNFEGYLQARHISVIMSCIQIFDKVIPCGGWACLLVYINIEYENSRNLLCLLRKVLMLDIRLCNNDCHRLHKL